MLRQATDPAYLADQYNDGEKLRIRLEAHRLYSERPNEGFHACLMEGLGIRTGDLLLDVGCGSGSLHARLTKAGARVVGIDASAGMLAEAAAQARAAELPVALARADAQAIPLTAACVNAVLASHMLYHVPDQRRALHEMQRVLAPGGRAVLATNAADFARELHDVHVAAARACGYVPGPLATFPFTLDDLPLVRDVFPNARVDRMENAFVFPTAEAALAYYATGGVDLIEDPPADASHRGPLLHEAHERIQTVIDREGVFRVSKTAGCFVASA
jgi:SAM-dependent methyltransferase